MQKNTYRYEQTAARLLVEGYPDLSASQTNDSIGILSGWRLQLVAAPELEGTREHLEALMAVVMPYARHCLSGVRRPFKTEQGFVSIGPDSEAHQLQLRSSRKGVDPLALRLDDAELSDLVRCLDRLRLDQRVQLSWELPADQPLPRHELVERIPLRRRFGPSFLGGFALAATAFIALVLPLPPQPQKQGVDEPGPRTDAPIVDAPIDTEKSPLTER